MEGTIFSLPRCFRPKRRKMLQAITAIQRQDASAAAASSPHFFRKIIKKKVRKFCFSLTTESDYVFPPLGLPALCARRKLTSPRMQCNGKKCVDGTHGKRVDMLIQKLTVNHHCWNCVVYWSNQMSDVNKADKKNNPHDTMQECAELIRQSGLNCRLGRPMLPSIGCGLAFIKRRTRRR